MNLRNYAAFFIFFFLVINFSGAQNILLLKRTDSFRNFKYIRGNHIKLKTSKSDRRISGQIHMISDSMILVDYVHEINIEDITNIYRSRDLVELGSSALMIAGVGYLVLDAFNHAINNDSPIFDETVAIVSASLVAAGGLMQTYKNRRFRIGKKWELQVLDYSFSKSGGDNK